MQAPILSFLHSGVFFIGFVRFTLFFARIAYRSKKGIIPPAVAINQNKNLRLLYQMTHRIFFT